MQEVCASGFGAGWTLNPKTLNPQALNPSDFGLVPGLALEGSGSNFKEHRGNSLAALALTSTPEHVI